MILVIGATGYIGRYLCSDLAKKGEKVLALGRNQKVANFFKEKNIKFQKFDITKKEDFELLPTKGVKCVINLAGVIAEHEVPVDLFFEANTLGTYNSLEFCRKNNIKNYILSSTHKVYNNIEKEVISEKETLNYRGSHTPYIISKIAAENFVEYYNKDFDMNGKVFRFTGVHGYGEILGHLNADGSYIKSTFEIFVEKSIKGEEIEVWGNTQIKRDHIYIKDLIDFLGVAIKYEKNKGIYNLATGIGLSLLEEAKGIAEVFKEKNKSIIISIPEKNGLQKGYIYDISKLKKEFNWEPKYSYIEMLRDYKKEIKIKEYHHYHYIKESQRPSTV